MITTQIINLRQLYIPKQVGRVPTHPKNARMLGPERRLAMDDFGIGYSSLAYLRKFPFDTLRIDQTLVQDLKNNPRDLTFMSAIIALARCLKLRVLAEGVETQEQLELLRGLECEEMQGNLFSKPITTEEVTMFLDIHSPINMRSP